MAVKASVDNRERHVVNRGGVSFPGKCKGYPFLGSISSFMQVRACSQLRVYDVEEVDNTSLTSIIVPDLRSGLGAGPVPAHPGAGTAHRGSRFQTTPAPPGDDPKATAQTTVEDDPSDGSNDTQPLASDEARALAQAENVDLNEVKGTGANGAVKVSDVRNHLENQKGGNG